MLSLSSESLRCTTVSVFEKLHCSPFAILVALFFCSKINDVGAYWINLRIELYDKTMPPSAAATALLIPGELECGAPMQICIEELCLAKLAGQSRRMVIERKTAFLFVTDAAGNNYYLETW